MSEELATPEETIADRTFEIPVFGDAVVNLPQLAFLVASFGLLLTAPVWGAPILYTLALANIWGIFAMSWDIISGHTGYISFGHSFLSGLAAYTTAILIFVVDPNMSVLVTFPLSVLVALVAGMFFAVPSLRLSGPYFSLLTFVSVLLAYKAVFVFSEYTNSEMGISGVSVLSYNNVELYYMTLGPMLLIGGLLLYVSRSNVGDVLLAIRDNEAAVEAAGLDTTKFKLWGFTLSAIPMGIGGTLLAHFYGNVEPIGFLIVDRSIEMIAMAVIGGMGTILGPLGGAYVLVVLRDSVFRLFLGPSGRWVALWIVVLLVLALVPQGVFRRLWQFLGDLGNAGGGDLSEGEHRE